MSEKMAEKSLSLVKNFTHSSRLLQEYSIFYRADMVVWMLVCFYMYISLNIFFANLCIPSTYMQQRETTSNIIVSIIVLAALQ